MFTAASLTIAKIWKQPKCSPADEWVKKLWYIYTMEYYLVITQNEMLPSATAWMDGHRGYYAHSEKDKYLMNSLICGN